jgi:hypothetical protein
MNLVRDPSSNSMRTSFVSSGVPKSAKQPSERRLDEEALSRMDDEGGSNDPAVNPPDAEKTAAPGS